MAEKKKLDQLHFLLAGLALLLLVFLIVVVTQKTPTKISMSFPRGSLILEPTEEKIDYESLLDKIYSTEFSKAGLMNWLDKKNIFSFEDPSIVTALNKKLCEPNTERGLEERFKRDRECAEEDVAAGLRELERKKKVPFHYLGSVVKVGIPSKTDQPPQNRANVCNNSDFFGARIKLHHPKNKKSIEVQATGKYLCLSPAEYPDIQLNSEDAGKLFPGSLQKYQEAVAIILSYDP